MSRRIFASTAFQQLKSQLEWIHFNFECSEFTREKCSRLESIILHSLTERPMMYFVTCENSSSESLAERRLNNQVSHRNQLIMSCGFRPFHYLIRVSRVSKQTEHMINIIFAHEWSIDATQLYADSSLFSIGFCEQLTCLSLLFRDSVIENRYYTIIQF